ncbi:MAG TPA: glycogen/starch synthase [Patescibacteria group bacterium]|nr:glycogen/starch synthase [Patescibacteria group bacterium]
MSQNHLKIVSVSSELHPFSKTGGLADVAESLPVALHQFGHTVICITPFYAKIIDPKKFNLHLFRSDIEVIIDSKNSVGVNFWQGELPGGPIVYFIENEKYFSRKEQLYTSEHENARFLLFNVAALKLLTLLKFKADIIQCHDWHAGLIPYYLKRDFKSSSHLQHTATVFTIHNIIYQLGHNWWEIPANLRDDGKSKLPLFDDPLLENINFDKRAILNADLINTVSENYVKEILTKENGQGLNILLDNRKDRLYGIINGIENDDYNPATDPGLKVNYSYKNIEAKAVNKAWLQKKYGLSIAPDLPLIIMSSRIAFEKGFNLVLEVLEHLARYNMQMIIMGDGDKNYISQIVKISKKYPGKLAWTPFEQKDETSLYAGGDLLVLPSNAEPCGINQLKALRYGCIPIVHSIGGLKDTITNFDFNNQDGNGFTFGNYSSLSFYGAIMRAREYYKNQALWKKLVVQSMKLSFSWDLPAQLYVRLFKKAIKLRQETS